ncbi:hypothetical protein CYMTET_28720 [Cymbomonas tetramitiformis]|uniref:Uncharacterized protein n=1 Tax=Cymbomonas tetramitiformis TaxID=36881 RepID=A0AAE0KVM4_9CHLO|nr:hypothetical protein CYMTET_28720 [Cymbomonas tetramitiformis]
MLCFSILGTQLFAGAFSACTDSSIEDFDDCTGTYTDSHGETVEREWQRAVRHHYDNVAEGFLTTFQLMALVCRPSSQRALLGELRGRHGRALWRRPGLCDAVSGQAQRMPLTCLVCWGRARSRSSATDMPGVGRARSRSSATDMPGQMPLSMPGVLGACAGRGSATDMPELGARAEQEEQCHPRHAWCAGARAGRAVPLTCLSRSSATDTPGVLGARAEQVQWPYIMQAGMDSVAPGKAMRENANPGAALYFMAVVLVMNGFFMNMIVGIVMDSAMMIKAADNFPQLPPTLREWMLILRDIESTRPEVLRRPPKHTIRRELYLLVNTVGFEWGIQFMILLNCTGMTLTYYGESEEYARLLEQVGSVFTYVFLLEMMLKMAALRNDYFKDSWNCFDCAIVTTSCLELMPLAHVIPSFKFLQIFRVLRLIRIVRKIHGVGPLFEALYRSFSSLLNVVGVMMLVSYVYAVAGVTIFGQVKHQPGLRTGTNPSEEGAVVVEGVRIPDLRVQEPECEASQNNCGSEFAVLFVPSFVVISQFIMLNIVMAVILNKYTECRNEQERIMNLDARKTFVGVWQRFDTEATGYIKVEHLYEMMTQLPYPIGLPKQKWSSTMFLSIACILNLPVYQIEYHYLMNSQCHYVEAMEAQSPQPESESGVPLRHIVESPGAAHVTDCVSFQDVLQAVALRAYIKEVVNKLSRRWRDMYSDFVREVVEVKRARSFRHQIGQERMHSLLKKGKKGSREFSPGNDLKTQQDGAGWLREDQIKTKVIGISEFTVDFHLAKCVVDRIFKERKLLHAGRFMIMPQSGGSTSQQLCADDGCMMINPVASNCVWYEPQDEAGCTDDASLDKVEECWP